MNTHEQEKAGLIKRLNVVLPIDVYLLVRKMARVNNNSLRSEVIQMVRHRAELMNVEVFEKECDAFIEEVAKKKAGKIKKETHPEN